MKKLIGYVAIFLFVFASCMQVSAKEDKVKLYFFHGDGCPHCKEENKYLKKLEKKYKKLEIVYYEVWNHKDNAFLMKRVGQKFDISANAVPLTVISSTAISGFSEVNEKKIERTINFYLKNKDKNIKN